MSVIACTHVGITVSDLEVSKRFYGEGLGFEVARTEGGKDHTIAANAEYGKLVSRLLEFEDDFEADIVFMSRDGQTIELVNYQSPKPQRHDRRPMNECGLTHMCFLVDDVESTAAKLVELGGSILEHTRIETDLPDGVDRTYILCLDPDGGVRVELIRAGALPST